MWICEQHGEQIPQHNGASYRCPLCTARVVWRDKPRFVFHLGDDGYLHRKLAEQAEEAS